MMEKLISKIFKQKEDEPKRCCTLVPNLPCTQPQPFADFDDDDDDDDDD